MIDTSPGGLLAKSAVLACALAMLVTGYGFVREADAVSAECGDYLEEPASVIGPLLVPSDTPSGIMTPLLEAGETYVLVAEGNFIYKGSGATSDSKELVVDGTRPFGEQSPDGRYCVELRGIGSRLLMQVQDSYYNDNDGYLIVFVVRR